MITQLDGDMVRTETVLPNGKTLYAEINIRENKTFTVGENIRDEGDMFLSREFFMGNREHREAKRTDVFCTELSLGDGK